MYNRAKEYIGKREKNGVKMKRGLIGIFVLGFVFTISGIVITANIATHQVTINIVAVDELIISGGDVTLTVDSATAGTSLDDVSDNACAFDWTTNSGTNKKITGQLDADYSSGVSLSVSVGVAGGNGYSTGHQMLISASAVDIVAGMHNENVGNNVLDYTTSVSIASPVSETRTVIYTITDQ